MSASEPRCRRYLVSGRVQGVFFRDSTRNRARELGLNGWVRNLRDGRVEALVIGEAPALSEMEKWLEIGPQYAKVTNIEKIDQHEYLEADNRGFSILPTEQGNP